MLLSIDYTPVPNDFSLVARLSSELLVGFEISTEETPLAIKSMRIIDTALECYSE